MKHATAPGIIASTLLAALTPSALAEDHPYGWRVGTDGEGAILVDFLWEMSHKKFFYDSAFRGAYDNSLRFLEYEFEVPELGFVPFDQAGAEIEIVFTHFDTGVFFRDTANPTLPVNTPGARYALGTTGDAFRTDSIWQVDPYVPGFDLQTDTWGVSFYFTDTTGTYADSQVYTYLLAPNLEVPAPSTLATLLLPLAYAGRRRR